ncbi:MAG: hypothetical protein J7502_03585 [Flavisolibacter sp.]|nr:hypothetical protein [Flavisolibacter sp.]
MLIANIPEHIAYLILLYMHGQLTPEQHDELDAWVTESNENQELFVVATDEDHINLSLNRHVYGPDYKPSDSL